MVARGLATVTPLMANDVVVPNGPVIPGLGNNPRTAGRIDQGWSVERHELASPVSSSERYSRGAVPAFGKELLPAGAFVGVIAQAFGFAKLPINLLDQAANLVRSGPLPLLRHTVSMECNQCAGDRRGVTAGDIGSRISQVIAPATGSAKR